MCDFYHISGVRSTHLTVTSLLVLNLDRLAQVVLVSFFHCKVTLSLLSELYSLEESHSPQSTRKEWILMLHLLEGDIYMSYF